MDTTCQHLMGCQGLERIELYDCQLITRAGIRRLRASYGHYMSTFNGLSRLKRE
jgi:F-box/leucine-rich repeat protein 2/20